MKLVIEIPEEYYNEMKNTSVWWSGLKKCVLNGKTLDSVLDEIKAEIDGAELPKNRMSFFRDGINYALQIIDKYKGKSEGV